MPITKFQTYNFADEQVRQEQKSYPKRRQVVSIVALSPDGQRVCLVMPDSAREDDRYNLTPPQCEIEGGKTISTTAAGKIEKGLGQPIVYMDVIYLTSALRTLPEGHKKRPLFTEAHHHWVAVSLLDQKLLITPPYVSAGWHQLTAMVSQSRLHMSPDKGEMCQHVLSLIKQRVGDTAIFRREKLRVPTQHA